MNLTEARDLLDGLNRQELPDASTVKALRTGGLVAAYCPDKSRVWVFGAARGEFRVNQGLLVSPKGVKISQNDDESGFLRALEDQDIHDYGRVPLSFETNSPHETFSVISGERLFCLGIIMDLKNL